jgi:hypothetical protein
MYKANKNIPVLFLGLAWIVFTFHLLIPHDHHLTDSYGNKEETCPSSKEKPGHNKGIPIHCHAFNDLASEKAIIIKIIRNIQSFDAVKSSFPDSIDFTLHLSVLTIPDIQKPVIDSGILELTSLRAPPTLT